MKKNRFKLFCLLSLIQLIAFANKPFQFALFTDMHISVSKPQNAEDLKLAINEVNANKAIRFVLIAGDDTDKGDSISLEKTKSLLSALRMPYYITSGNHDTGGGKLGSSLFKKILGNDKFSFRTEGYQFIGFPSGPIAGTSIGQIAEEDKYFLTEELSKNSKIPSFLITHYPLLEGDIVNPNDFIRDLKKYSVIAVLGGHYHRNAIFNYDGIYGIINRSILRSNDIVGGYSIFEISDSIQVSEKCIGRTKNKWLDLGIYPHNIN